MLVGGSKVPEDDLGLAALLRLADARDVALSQSNRFILAGLASSLFYAIKAVGLRIDLVVADTKIFDVPYGLFVFGVFGSVCFVLAQLRFLDAKALDIRLKRLAGAGEASVINYDSFPSVHNWLLPAYMEFGGEGSGRLTGGLFLLLGFIAICIYSSPLWASVHFLLSWPEMAGESYNDFQWWLIIVLLFVAVVSYIFSQSIYAKREK